MPDEATHYKLYLLLTMAVDNFVFSILMFGHPPLVVYLCVSECICVSTDMLPYCSPRDEWLIMTLLQVCQVQYCQHFVNF